MSKYKPLIIAFVFMGLADSMDILSSLLNNWFTPGIVETNPFAQTASQQFSFSHGLVVKLCYTAAYALLSSALYLALRQVFIARFAALVASLPVWFNTFAVMIAVLNNFFFLLRLDRA